MKENHFNSSLSAVQKWRSNTIVKAKVSLTVTFTMTNGDCPTHAKPILISLDDVELVYNHAYEKYENYPSKLNLRDFVIVRVVRKIGLRNSEVRTLKIELINFSQRFAMVLDSKKGVYFKLPFDVLTLHFMRELADPRRRGYLIIHEGGTWTKIKHGKPLTKMQVYNIVHNLALEVGVEGFSPRSLRRAFAYEWNRKIKDKNSKKTLKGLQLMMRHVDWKTTGLYVDKMFCFEDLQREFDDAPEEKVEGCRLSQTKKELMES